MPLNSATAAIAFDEPGGDHDGLPRGPVAITAEPHNGPRVSVGRATGGFSSVPATRRACVECSNRTVPADVSHHSTTSAAENSPMHCPRVSPPSFVSVVAGVAAPKTGPAGAARGPTAP